MTEMIHERQLPVGECSNFRDLGGYLTADKKFKTRWNRLYRSDHLAKIGRTEENVHLLRDTLMVKTTIDLRGEEEKKNEPYRIPGITTAEIAIEPGNIMHTLTRMSDIFEQHAVDVMVQLNEVFVTQFQEQYKEFLALVIAKGKESPDNALVFHCTAGKDRTGYAAALILLLLGVDNETVFKDYLLTNTYFKPPSLDNLMRQMSGERSIEKRALEALFFVRPEYLQKALDTIDSRYGGLLHYAKTALGISEQDINDLKAAYLEPA